jgi:hypothetical protein
MREVVLVILVAFRLDQKDDSVRHHHLILFCHLVDGRVNFSLGEGLDVVRVDTISHADQAQRLGPVVSEGPLKTSLELRQPETVCRVAASPPKTLHLLSVMLGVMSTSMVSSAVLSELCVWTSSSDSSPSPDLCWNTSKSSTTQSRSTLPSVWTSSASAVAARSLRLRNPSPSSSCASSSPSRGPS